MWSLSPSQVRLPVIVLERISIRIGVGELIVDDAHVSAHLHRGRSQASRSAGR